MNKEVFFNLPKKVVFCKTCVMSNQRPSSVQEFKHVKERKGAIYLNINEEGVCDACLQNEIKNNQINWEDREEELLKILEKHRKNDGSYDCLVPGSGGKDSVYQAHILKYKYGMHPLLTTWSPILYTDYGYENYKNWIEIGGFDNVTFKPNGKAMKTLTRLSIENLLHPFQTFILGQKNLAPKIASQYGIDLVFYGENEAEYGNPLADNAKSLRDKSYFTYKNINDIFLGGLPIKQILEEHDLSLADLTTFLPLAADEFDKTNIQIHYLGYYLRWIPQEAYYYAVEHTNFCPNPERSEGTFSKYNSIDDKLDGFHYWCGYIKFGIGRCTHEASQEVRNGHIEREEAIALVKRFDGEFPKKYYEEILQYLDLDHDTFMGIADSFRSEHLWEKTKNSWKLRHTVC